MATNLDLDDKLVKEAVKLGKHKTKKDAVNAALGDYVRHLKQLRVFELVGKVEFDPDWDYKALRKQRRKWASS